MKNHWQPLMVLPERGLIGPGPVAHDGGRSFCVTATSAGLDGADLNSDQTVLNRAAER